MKFVSKQGRRQPALIHFKATVLRGQVLNGLLELTITDAIKINLNFIYL